ncbi:MAG: hypothetical protein EA364_08115 [Balneolaceae bacterium]|nr:MAG: hypothetical protein EA364_08115 [Balneolaceae bacterium]
MKVRYIQPAVIVFIVITALSCDDPNRPGSGLSGVWEGTINGYSQVSMNDTQLVVTLTQDDRSLFGTVSLPEADRVHAIENGNLDEFFIRFSFTSAGLITSFNGTLKGRNMEGTWVLRQGQETIESGSWQVRFVSR